MKNHFFAATIQKNGKYYSFVMKIGENENAAAKLKHPDIIIAQLCSSKKAAAYVVNHWNACHKTNGQYLFDDPAINTYTITF